MKKWFDKILHSFIRQNPEERPSQFLKGSGRVVQIVMR